MHVAFFKYQYGNLADKIAARWTRGPYSHCELLFSDGKSFTCQIKHNKTAYIDFKHGPQWDLVEVDVKEHNVRAFCDDQLQFKYDYLALVGFTLYNNLRLDSRWVCSNLCASALVAGGLRIPTHVHPNELHRELTK
jgi:hypothetical protein